MEEQSQEAWIIMYIWQSTDDWIGAFPDQLHQWFVCEFTSSKYPRIFDSKKLADEYAIKNALYNYKTIQAAGEDSEI